MTDPFEPFNNIRDAIKRIVEPMGVEFITWSIIPGDDEGDEHACSILLEIKPEAFLSDDEKQIRQTLQEMEDGERALEAAQRAREASEKTKADLVQISKDGIFADSPEE